MKKFADAFHGLMIAFHHKSVRIQLFLAMMATAGGLILRLDIYEWLCFCICIGIVIAAEIFNTAIERICDYQNRETDERIRIIKDLSSAAVLVVSIVSLSVAMICLFRRLMR